MSGLLYLLHFDPPYRHARHYLGFTARATADQRILDHLNGQGSPLVRAAVEAGCEIRVAWTRPGTRTEERRLKNLKATPSLCPICRSTHNQEAY